MRAWGASAAQAPRLLVLPGRRAAAAGAELLAGALAAELRRKHGHGPVAVRVIQATADDSTAKLAERVEDALGEAAGAGARLAVLGSDRTASAASAAGFLRHARRTAPGARPGLVWVDANAGLAETPPPPSPGLAGRAEHAALARLLGDIDSWRHGRPGELHGRREGAFESRRLAHVGLQRPSHSGTLSALGAQVVTASELERAGARRAAESVARHLQGSTPLLVSMDAGVLRASSSARPVSPGALAQLTFHLRRATGSAIGMVDLVGFAPWVEPGDACSPAAIAEAAQVARAAAHLLG